MMKYLIITVTLMLNVSSYANISLPDIFSDHMVLQQESMVPIWGWGKPNEEVVITASWDSKKQYKTKITSNSRWELLIETPSAGGPYEINISGYNQVEIKDVLIGEVWLGSGQSNMEWSAHLGIDNADEERRLANYPEIRFFTVLTSTAATPQQHLKGEWVVCTPESMYYFSALMYFFGRELHQTMDVPVGLIHSSWGGTPVEVWIPAAEIEGDRYVRENAKILGPMEWGPHEPGRAYNAMIHPVIPYKIKGALWYQGETNVGNPNYYARSLALLIESWRAAWGENFPFYYAQIAPYRDYGSDNVNGALLRDQQRMVMDLSSNTGMVVTADIGDLDDIHPGNKQDVGKRLASWALFHQYNVHKAYSGPLPEKVEHDKNKLIIHFKHARGLKADGKLDDFEVLDSDGNWESVKAKISDNTVELKVKRVDGLKSVRYAYSNIATGTLRNEAGLPASCFKIDL